MAIVAGTTYHFTDLPPYLSLLLQLNKMTPFANLAASKNGIRTVGDKNFDMSQVWSVDPGAQTGLSEEDTVNGVAPTRVTRGLEQNGIQLFQHRPKVSYLRESIQNASAPQLAGKEYVNGNGVVDPVAFQIEAHLQKIQKDWDFSSLLGALNVPNDETEDFQMGGIIPAITTNAVDGAAAPLSTDLVNQTLISMTENGAPFEDVHIICSPTTKTWISKLYGLADRDSFNFGGVRVDTMVTDFALIPIIVDVHVPNGTILFADMRHCQPVVLPYNGQAITVERKSETGASQQWHVYAQGSFDYGSESVHAKLTNFIAPVDPLAIPTP